VNRVELIEFNSTGHLQPAYHVFADQTPEAIETERQKQEQLAGAPTTMTRLAVTYPRRPKRTVKWFNALIRRRQQEIQHTGQ